MTGIAQAVFLMRGRAAVATLTCDVLVAASETNGEIIELTQAQEAELPQAMKWQLGRSDEAHDAAIVEVRRITVEAARVASVSFPCRAARSRTALPPRADGSLDRS